MSSVDKNCPLVEGLIDMFPNALAEVARHSKYSGEKYHGGKVRWLFDVSVHHAESLMRHLFKRGSVDYETARSHTIGVAWRALALLETELINAGAEPGRGVVFTEPRNRLQRMVDELRHPAEKLAIEAFKKEQLDPRQAQKAKTPEDRFAALKGQDLDDSSDSD